MPDPQYLLPLWQNLECTTDEHLNLKVSRGDQGRGNQHFNSQCDFPEGVTPPSGPPEDDPPSPPPATSSSASSFGNSGRMAPPATSQRSFALNEEGVYAEEINRAQGGGQSYPSPQCLVH